MVPKPSELGPRSMTEFYATKPKLSRFEGYDGVVFMNDIISDFSVNTLRIIQKTRSFILSNIGWGFVWLLYDSCVVNIHLLSSYFDSLLHRGGLTVWPPFPIF